MLSVLMLFMMMFLPLAAMAEPAPEGCAEHFLGREMPTVVNRVRTNKTRLLCFSQYALLHSGVAKTAVWSAEHLTSDRIEPEDPCLARTGANQSPTALPLIVSARRRGMTSVANSRSERHTCSWLSVPKAKIPTRPSRLPISLAMLASLTRTRSGSPNTT